MDNQKERKLIKIALVVSIIGLFILFIACFGEIREIGKRNPDLSLQVFLSARRNQGPLPSSDATLVKPWMTFDYINHLFDLPEGYLASTTDIRDARYPKVSIHEYAEDAGTSTVGLLLEIENAITIYASSTEP